MSRAEKQVIEALAKVQQAYLALAHERANEGDIFAVAKAVQRSNEAGSRLDKLSHRRWVA